MINADPLRTPSFVLFGNPDYFYETGSCPSGSTPGCPVVDPGFAWNHGDDNPEIARTWVGYVRPTVKNLGQTDSIWTDHTDVRSTMLEALGLSDDYTDDGNAVTEVLRSRSLPVQLRRHLSVYQRLAETEKQLNAPFGQFGHDSDLVSTTAVESNSPGDTVARGLDQQLQTCNARRNALAGRIQPILQAAEFGGGTIPPQSRQLVHQAKEHIADMNSPSKMSVLPDHAACG
jgi:hypothetical protein